MNIQQKTLRSFLLWKSRPKDCLSWLIHYRTTSPKRETFTLGGIEYPYFFHPYNCTWINERTVEIPVIQSLINSATPSSMLEVGNVLSYYFDLNHTVLDKWEQSYFRPVINQDILLFNPQKRFDVIVSISTIEHVGWDECPKAEDAVIIAFKKLQSLLTPTGKAFVTIPVGYNHYLDQSLPDLVSNLVVPQCLKRISQDNHWIEVEFAEALQCKYGEPYGCANAVVFLSIYADPNKK